MIRVNCLQNESESNDIDGDRSQPEHISSRGSSVLRSLGRLYLILWMTAVGGLVLANVAGLLAMFLATENKAEAIRPWTQGGWCAGAVLAFFGAVTGKLRMHSGKNDFAGRESLGSQRRKAGNLSQSRDLHSSNDSQGKARPSILEPCDAEDSESGERSSLLSAVAFFGFLGGLAGVCLGGSLLVFYFSLAFSPLSTSWSAFVKAETQATGRNPKRTVLVSRDKLAWSLVLLPAAIGMTTGAVAGGIGAVRGKITDG